MNIVSVSKKRVEVIYFRGSEKIMDIFSHMRVNGIYWSPFWEGDNFWGTETITFGWPLNTLSNKKKSGNCSDLLFWQCQDFKSAIHPFFLNRHSSFLSWIRLKQMISLLSSPWGVFFWHSCGNTFKSSDIGREKMLCNFFTQEQQTE